MEQKFDVMEGVNMPMRVMQWATREEVEEFCERTGRVIIAENRIGNVLSEVTVIRTAKAEA